MAKGSSSKPKPNFAMTPEMKKFQYELAQEIGLTNTFINPKTKTDSGLGPTKKK